MDEEITKKQNSFNELQVFIGQFFKQACAVLHVLVGTCGLINFLSVCYWLAVIAREITHRGSLLVCVSMRSCLNHYA